MLILDLIFGFLLVLAGRNLFWLCVGIVGFLIGAQCAVLLGLSNGWIELFVALFLGGGYLLMSIFPPVIGQEAYSWLIFVVGGIVGLCLMIIIFDWALIIIS